MQQLFLYRSKVCPRINPEKLIKKLTMGVIVLICFCSTAFSADYSAWAHHKNFVLNTSSSGAAVSANVRHFPILVRLTADNFTFSEAATDGKDIRFAKSNGTTALSYQIELWDAAHSSAAIWVSIDTVYGNNYTQKIMMYWGNSSAVSESNGTTVFDTSNGFAAVWHLSDTTDATKNLNKLTRGLATSAPVCSSGIVGKSYYFDGVDDSLRAANASSFNFCPNFTVSLWAKYEAGADPDYNRMVCRKRFYTSNYGWDVDLDMNMHSGLNILTGGNHTFYRDSIVNTLWSAGEWHYVSVVFKAESVTVYGEGLRKSLEILKPRVLVKSDSVCTPYILAGETLFTTCDYLYDTTYVDTGISWLPTDTALPVLIGANSLEQKFFWGRMDEVRLDKTPRSSDWIKLCYENQKASQSLVWLEGTVGTLRPAFSDHPDARLFNYSGQLVAKLFDVQGRCIVKKILTDANRLSTLDDCVRSLRKEVLLGAGTQMYILKLYSENNVGKLVEVASQKVLMAQ